MLIWIRRLLAAPVFEDEGENRTARLLNSVSLIIIAANLLFIPFLVISAPTPAAAKFDLVVGVATFAMMSGALFLLRRGYLRVASTICSLFLLILVTGTLYAFRGIRNPLASFYVVVVAFAALLLGGRAALIFGLLSALATLGIYFAEINNAIIFAMPMLVEPFDWILLCLTLTVGALVMRYAVNATAEGFERARRHARDLAELNRELTTSRDMLQAQTHVLERRARYLEATATVAREATEVLDLQALLSRVVTLISTQFGFYHVGVFLLDSTGKWAELCAASSDGGQRMLARGHRLQVGEQGIVGYVIAQGEHRVALDVGEDAVYFDNPDLPETRSEVALPLKVRGEVIGALDVQSTEPAAFTEEDVNVLQTLADQIATAINNARLFQQAQEALEMERRAYGEISREAWVSLIRARPNFGFRRGKHGILPLGDTEPLETPREYKPTTQTIPIKVRGHTIGVIDAYKPDDAGKWTPEETAVMETLAEQLGMALESARLYQEARRHAARDRVLADITARVRASMDPETILRTAVRELSLALGTDRASVHTNVGGGLGTLSPQDGDSE